MDFDWRRLMPHSLVLVVGGFVVVTGAFVLRRPFQQDRADVAQDDELAESESSWLEWRGPSPVPEAALLVESRP